MNANDMITVYLLGLATYPALRVVADAAGRVRRRWRPERVLCAGCGRPGGVTVVTDPGQVTPGMGGLFAWHRPCLDKATIHLPVPFTGRWDELDELLPAPIGAYR